MQQATFGEGCFCEAQYEFDQLKGVKIITVDILGGHTKNPTYDELCTDKTGHAEVIYITFDESLISYDSLLEHFWEIQINFIKIFI